MLKYFDVTLPEPVAMAELPASVVDAALPLLPAAVQRDWVRAMYQPSGFKPTCLSSTRG